MPVCTCSHASTVLSGRPLPGSEPGDQRLRPCSSTCPKRPPGEEATSPRPAALLWRDWPVPDRRAGKTSTFKVHEDLVDTRVGKHRFYPAGLTAAATRPRAFHGAIFASLRVSPTSGDVRRLQVAGRQGSGFPTGATSLLP